MMPLMWPCWSTVLYEPQNYCATPQLHLQPKLIMKNSKLKGFSPEFDEDIRLWVILLRNSQPSPRFFSFFFFSLGLKPYVACKYSHLHSCLPWVISKDSLQARTGTRWQWFLIIWILIQNKSFSLQFLKVILHDPFVLYLAGYRAEIVSGKTTLQELASTESDCSSARNDGDLGFFGPGQMQSKS